MKGSLQIEDIRIEEFDYQLPAERIAVYPVEPRDSSRLLVYKDGDITDDVYSNISHYIPPSSFMVFNDTKVIYARLVFRDENGREFEIFCLEPSENTRDISVSMQQTESVVWKCMVGNLKKYKGGELYLKTADSSVQLKIKAEIIGRISEGCIILFTWEPSSLSFAEVLNIAGKVPLPPYIKRATEANDKNRYQTVYAREEGSVAAPTAGLHYTDRVFSGLAEKNIERGFITLHVGAGTFKPVKTSSALEHRMHSEQIQVCKTFLTDLISRLDNDIVAVGTTSLRTLESLYWLGLKLGTKQTTEELVLGQWEPYQLEDKLTVREALYALVNYLDEAKQELLYARTEIMIMPGYKWKLADALATNFHQPKSTLILLVAAFTGQNWKEIYRHALENNYRFLSYGDGSLLFRSS